MPFKRKRKAAAKKKAPASNGQSPAKKNTRSKPTEPEVEPDEEVEVEKSDEISDTTEDQGDNGENQDTEEEKENDSEDEDIYVMEAVAGVCLPKATGLPEILIKWKGFPIDESTWEPIGNIHDNNALVHFQPLLDKIAEFKPSKGGGAGKKKQPKLAKKSEQEYEVEELLGIWYDHEDDVIRYQIKWKDYPFSQNTWETEANLTSCSDFIEPLTDAIEYLQKTFMKDTTSKSTTAKRPTGRRAGKRASK